MSGVSSRPTMALGNHFMQRMMNYRIFFFKMSTRKVTEYGHICIIRLTCASSWEEASLCISRMHWLTVFSNSRAVCIASSPLPHVSCCGFCRISTSHNKTCMGDGMVLRVRRDKCQVHKQSKQKIVLQLSLTWRCVWTSIIVEAKLKKNYTKTQSMHLESGANWIFIQWAYTVALLMKTRTAITLVKYQDSDKQVHYEWLLNH